MGRRLGGLPHRLSAQLVMRLESGTLVASLDTEIGSVMECVVLWHHPAGHK